MNLIRHLRSLKDVCFWSKVKKTFFLGIVLLLVIPVLQVAYYKRINPHSSNLMWKRHFSAKNRIPMCDLQKTWIKGSEVSPHLTWAVLMAEDLFFHQHKGVYFPALVDALEKDLSGKKTPGNSTITQQTAKNLFLYPKRSYFRKGIEVYYALLMEAMWGKDRIIEMYLNIIELGNGVFGIENGSQKWFKKSSKDMSFDEACLFASIISNPRNLTPFDQGGVVNIKAAHFYRKGYRKAMSFENAPPVHAVSEKT